MADKPDGSVNIGTIGIVELSLYNQRGKEETRIFADALLFDLGYLSRK